jgi:hypothetical protein
MAETNINWKDPALTRWLDSITRNSTRYVYKSAFKAYANFIGSSASALVNEGLADLKKNPRKTGRSVDQ